jgi:hypothetical protein
MLLFFCLPHNRKVKEQRVDNCVLVEQHVYPRTVVSVSVHYKSHLSVLVKCKAYIIIIPLKFNFFLPWYSRAIDHFVLSNSHSFAHICLILTIKYIPHVMAWYIICTVWAKRKVDTRWCVANVLVRLVFRIM